jgi:hypothetical protein
MSQQLGDDSQSWVGSQQTEVRVGGYLSVSRVALLDDATKQQPVNKEMNLCVLEL